MLKHVQGCGLGVGEGNEENTVLSISFEVDVPTGKVGGSLLFESQRRELPRGVLGACSPRKF